MRINFFRRRKVNIGFYGNCQVETLGLCFEKLFPSARIVITPKISTATSNIECLADCDYVFIQSAYWTEMRNNCNINSKAQIFKCPNFYFSGFFPDVLIQDTPVLIQSAGGIYNSSIALYGYVSGMSVDGVLSLFQQEVYMRLGFYEHYELSKKASIADLLSCGIDGKRLFAEWEASGIFAYTPNHPTVDISLSIARAISKLAGLKPARVRADQVRDALWLYGQWPVYPQIAAAYGLGSGSMDFNFVTKGDGVRQTLSLRDFVELSYAKYRASSITREMVTPFVSNPNVYSSLETLVNSRPESFRDNRFYDDWLLDMLPYTPCGANAYEVAATGAKSIRAGGRVGMSDADVFDARKRSDLLVLDPKTRIEEELRRSAKVVCEEEMLVASGAT